MNIFFSIENCCCTLICRSVIFLKESEIYPVDFEKEVILETRVDQCQESENMDLLFCLCFSLKFSEMTWG